MMLQTNSKCIHETQGCVKKVESEIMWYYLNHIIKGILLEEKHGPNLVRLYSLVLENVWD